MKNTRKGIVTGATPCIIHGYLRSTCMVIIMKIIKSISVFLAFVIVFGALAVPAIADDSIRVLLNNTELAFDVPPTLINGRTMVPMRKIFEELGAEVEWEDETQAIKATKDDIVIGMQINNSIMSVNDNRIILDVPPQLVNNRTLVPVRGVFEQLGFEAEWDSVARQATLKNAAHTIVITIGSNVFTTNGVSHSLDVPAQLIGNRTMLPLRFPLESIGYYLDWDSQTRTAIVSTSLATRPALRPRVGSEFGYGNTRLSEMHYGVRHDFEHDFIPQVASSRASEITGFLRNNNASGFSTMLNDGWVDIAARWIGEDLAHIGSSGANINLDNAISRERAFNDYGLTPSFHIQNITIESINPTTTAAIISMSDSGWFILSTHIALVHNNSSGIEVFLLERDFNDGSRTVFLFRHLSSGSRESISVIDNSLTAFINDIKEFYS